MIISASRRTDIPAFYGEWFMNRIKDKYVLIRNPFYRKQVSKVILNPDTIECIVFWTKNPAPFIKHLGKLQDTGYNFCFLFTITPYGADLEQNIPGKKKLIDCFKNISDMVGPEKMIWRYDPIIITPEFDFYFHKDCFTDFCQALKGYTNHCITSFIEMYKKCILNLRDLEIIEPDIRTKESLLSALKNIAETYSIIIQTCAVQPETDFLKGIKGRCIDNDLISRICGKSIPFKKDPSQRKECGCIGSIDIGAYNSCQGYCLYCYANQNRQRVEKSILSHNPSSPLLIGDLENGDRVFDRN